AATQTLQELYIEAAERIIQENRFSQLSVPEQFAQLCRQSWQRKEEGRRKKLALFEF
ncbi:MAG: glutathionylspermidine synthase family protein, partial [Okeania sp. SIO2D1]|nr:glutathionylspermidine synthase family protein [Okeania sp. SIO2D1]